jgi:Helix-turn-helix domain
MSETGDGEWLTTEEFAKRLRIDPATARNWRRSGYGPLAVPFGGIQRYRVSAVIAFEKEQEAAAAAEHARRASGPGPAKTFKQRIGAGDPPVAKAS